jgi:methionyl-tRNA formyltransferase
VKVVFFGSPEFAVASLEALLASHHQVVGVVTQPDRPAGRGLKLEPPAVKVLALKHNLPIHQPEKVNCQETYDFLDRLDPDILTVIAYGGFLGKKLLEPRRFPPVNVHPSLLPDLRGAAPMQWALLRGYPATGVTTQFMVKEMDAGDVLLQTNDPIGEDENAAELQNRLKRRPGRRLGEAPAPGFLESHLRSAARQGAGPSALRRGRRFGAPQPGPRPLSLAFRLYFPGRQAREGAPYAAFAREPSRRAGSFLV